MIEVEFFAEGKRAMFSRSAPFELADESERQLELAEAFAEQCSRMSWPVTFPEPSRGWLPILEFFQGSGGIVAYRQLGWTSPPSSDAEPESSDPA